MVLEEMNSVGLAELDTFPKSINLFGRLDFMCYDNKDALGEEEHSCQPQGPANIPTNYFKSSNCYDPTWDEAAEEFENSGL